MVPLKIFQKCDPDRVIALLYWRDTTVPSYVNYCVGLGLVPWGGRLDQLPFVNAAFETRRLEMIDAGLAPNWQRDWETDVEAYALRQGPAAVVFCVGRGPSPERADIAFDAAPAGLSPGKPFFTWLFELADCRDWHGRLTEQQQREAYEQAAWAEEMVVAGRLLESGKALPSRYQRPLLAKPGTLRLMTATHCPAVVWSIHGRRTNFWLPSVRHVDCSGQFEPESRRSRIQCRVGEDCVEIAVVVPEGLWPDTVQLNGAAADWRPTRVDGTWLALVRLGKGEHRVDVEYRPVATDDASAPLEVRVPEQVEAGKPVPVRIGGLKRCKSGVLVRVLHDGVVVASHVVDGVAAGSGGHDTQAEDGGFVFELPIPETARPGLYDIAACRFGYQGSHADDPQARVSIPPSPWQQANPPKPQHGRPLVKVWPVDRTIDGIEILRAATDTFDHRDGIQLAEWDLDALTCRCGLQDESRSPWGYGFSGIEIRGVKQLTLELENTFAKAHKEGFELGDRHPDSFAGLIIDYHTEQGYTHRAALSLGVMKERRPVTAPNWGKASPPDEIVDFSRTLLDKSHDTIEIDLGRFAPDGWDGTAWFAVGVDTVYRGLKVVARVRAVED